jgi:hypothetical protein
MIKLPSAVSTYLMMQVPSLVRYGVYVTFALAVWSQRIIVAVEHRGRFPVTSYTMRNFEDVVIFVADMERAIERLNPLEKKATSHECSGGILNPRGCAAARMYAEDGRAVPARCAGPALADPACGWFDGTITLSYGRIKNLSRG